MAKHALRQGVVPASSLPSLLALSIASALAAPAVYAALRPTTPLWSTRLLTAARLMSRRITA